jgi:hypothetical protein
MNSLETGIIRSDNARAEDASYDLTAIDSYTRPLVEDDINIVTP